MGCSRDGVDGVVLQSSDAGDARESGEIGWPAGKKTASCICASLRHCSLVLRQRRAAVRWAGIGLNEPLQSCMTITTVSTRAVTTSPDLQLDLQCSSITAQKHLGSIFMSYTCRKEALVHQWWCMRWAASRTHCRHSHGATCRPSQRPPSHHPCLQHYPQNTPGPLCKCAVSWSVWAR